MKRISTLIIFTFLIFSHHDLAAQYFNIGGGLGINTPSVIGGGSDSPLASGNSFSFGGDFGVFGEYRIVDSYSCSVGLDYSSQAGWYRLKYIKIPFLAKQTWFLDYQTKYYAGAGPFVGYLLDYNKTINPYILQNPNKFNVGVQAMAGISHRFNGVGSFFFEVGLDWGFIRLQKPYTQMKRHMFSNFIKVGYIFPLVPKWLKERNKIRPFRAL